MKVERLETSSKEKSQKKKFSKGASSSSGKRARDVQAESVQGSTIRGRRQGGIVVSSGVEVLQLDREESRSALISIDNIRVFTGC